MRGNVCRPRKVALPGTGEGPGLESSYGARSVMPDAERTGRCVSLDGCRSKTSFEADNYTRDYVGWNQPGGFVNLIKGHPCYNPVKVRQLHPSTGQLWVIRPAVPVRCMHQ
jgi:hypothetical protein